MRSSVPRSAALVHHGGIGTLSQGLAGGVPQIVMPMGFDQFDNAARITRLGVGRTLGRSRYRLPHVARALAGLLADEHQAAAAIAVSRHLLADKGVETACNVFNQVVDLRFGSMLSQCRLVVDERYNRIDGVLGPRTHYLENSTFVELVESILVDAADVTFAGATAIGRKLFLRYHEPEVITTLDGPYRRGFAFFVSEAGDDSIRPYRLYERVADGGTCLQVPSIRRSRQKRTGSKFAAKLRQMLVSVLQSEPCDIAAEIEAMHDSHVFTDDFSSEGVQSVVRSWRRRLRLGGVPSDIAEGIASSPFGYDNSEASPLSDTVLASKTEYDLVRAAIADATTRGQRVRELVERAAFSVFIQDKQ